MGSKVCLLHIEMNLVPWFRKFSNTTAFFNKGVKEFEARWIGWAGVNVPDEIGQKALTKALAEKVLCVLHHNIKK